MGAGRARRPSCGWTTGHPRRGREPERRHAFINSCWSPTAPSRTSSSTATTPASRACEEAARPRTSHVSSTSCFFDEAQVATFEAGAVNSATETTVNDLGRSQGEGRHLGHEVAALRARRLPARPGSVHAVLPRSRSGSSWYYSLRVQALLRPRSPPTSCRSQVRRGVVATFLETF